MEVGGCALEALRVSGVCANCCGGLALTLPGCFLAAQPWATLNPTPETRNPISTLYKPYINPI